MLLVRIFVSLVLLVGCFEKQQRAVVSGRWNGTTVARIIFNASCLFTCTTRIQSRRLDRQCNGFAKKMFVFECILKLFALFSIANHRRRDCFDRWCNGLH